MDGGSPTLSGPDSFLPPGFLSPAAPRAKGIKERTKALGRPGAKGIKKELRALGRPEAKGNKERSRSLGRPAG